MKPISFIALILAIALPTLASAQTYKCVIGGKTVYADAPCAQDAKNVSAGQDAVNERERQETRIRYLEGKVDTLNKEATRDKTFDQQQRSVAAERESAKSAKAKKCQGYLADAKRARDDLGWLRYHGGLMDDARRREKEANDKHFSECFGSQGG